jgi:hypothetical protein
MRKAEKTVVLLHATEVRNVPSVKKYGLLCRKATRKRRAVWLANENEEKRAAGHCAANRHCAPDDIAIFTVEIPVSWIRGFRWGFWYCEHDIPASMLRSVKRYRPEVEILS